MTVPRTHSAWRKASYSSTETNCVEVALDPQGVRVRDTKARDQGNLEVPARAWRTLAERL